MLRRPVLLSVSSIVAVLAATPALAHHVMDGDLPVTFADGLLSGLGHPIIGLDHLAAVVAVGCLAAMHRSAAGLAAVYMLAMIAGVAVHINGPSVPGAELLVALTVLALGVLMLRRRVIPVGAALALFAGVGLIHGYVMGESIVGAEPAPFYAYLSGLATIQTAVALAAMSVARMLMRRSGEPALIRLVGAGIAGFGLVILVQQVVSA